MMRRERSLERDSSHGSDLSSSRLTYFDFDPTRSTSETYLPSRPMSQNRVHRRPSFSCVRIAHRRDANFEASLVQVLTEHNRSSCELRLEPAVVAFIASELIVERGESVREYVVLTGGSHGVWATTYEQYVRATWPDLAEQILEIFDVLVLSLNRSKSAPRQDPGLTGSSAKITNKIQFRLQLPKPNRNNSSYPTPAWADIHISSTRPVVARVVDAIAWFCATAQSTRQGLSFSGCALYQQHSQEDDVIFDLATDWQASLVKHGLDWRSDCWMPLVPNFSIAGDHASRPRPWEIRGMEVAFDLMCYLCGLQYEIIEDGGLVLYGKKSMVYPVRQVAECVEWHFERSEDAHSPPTLGRGQRLSLTDLSALRENKRHFIGLWTDPRVTLGTDQCDHRQIYNSALPIKDWETKRDGRFVGVSIGTTKVITFSTQQSYKTTSTRRNPYTEQTFLGGLYDMKADPVLLYSVSEQRAWLVSYLSVVWHLARAKAHKLGYSIPACRSSSDGGEAALITITECYERPMKIASPQEQLNRAGKKYTIEIFVKEICAALDSAKRECNRKRNIFSDQMIGYEMADFAQSRPELRMKACKFASSGWAPLLDEIPRVLFCEGLQDPIVNGSRTLPQSHCTAGRWDYIPTDFNILTASLPCVEKLCYPFNTEGSMDKLTASHKWHVPGTSTTSGYGHPFDDCRCVRGRGCHKLQDVRKVSRVMGLSSPINPPSRGDLSKYKSGAVIFQHKVNMESIVRRLAAREPRQQQVALRTDDHRLSTPRDNVYHDDSGYSSGGSSRSRETETKPRNTGRESQRTGHTTTQDEVRVVPNHGTHIKLHQKYIDERTLEHYDLPWERDSKDRKYFIVTKYLDHDCTDKLFKHAEMLRQQDMLKRKEGTKTEVVTRRTCLRIEPRKREKRSRRKRSNSIEVQVQAVIHISDHRTTRSR